MTVNPTTSKTFVRVGAGFLFVALLLWLVSALESVSTMIMVSFFIAYILNPLVTSLEHRGLGRSAVSLLVLLVLIAIVLGLVLLVAPAIFSELVQFSRRAPRYFARLQDLGASLVKTLQLDVPQDWNEFILLVFDKIRQSLPKITYTAGTLVASIFSSTISALSVMLKVALTPIITYYVLASFEDTVKGAVDLIPPYTRDPIVKKFQEIDSVIAAFVRGQLTIALIMAGLYSLGFLIIGIDMPIVLGVVSGLLFVVPYLGTLVGIVGGSIMAFVKFGDILHVVYILLWIGAVQTFESYFLTPKIVGKAVGLNPVLYIIVLIVGANLFGFVGMLVAIPVAAVGRVLLISAVDLYKNSYLYKETEHNP
ncbi:MAG: AI-2E family transporter [Desulfomonilaceae bacterium]